MTTTIRLEKTITLQDVIEIHDDVMNDSGGINGFSGDKSLESALCRIDHRMHYENLENPFEIAAWYAYAIARGHTFIDGNKRTAFICMKSYLDAINIELEFKETNDQLADYMENLADGKITIEDLTRWLMSSSLAPD